MAILEVHDGRGRVERVTISRDTPVMFGASPMCDVVLDGEGVAPFHGRIRWRKTSFKAEASPDVPTIEVNGVGVKSAFFRQGDEIRVGPCRVFFISEDAIPRDAKTVIQPPPRVGSGNPIENWGPAPSHAPKARAKSPAEARRGVGLEGDDWLEVLEVAPPSVEVEVVFQPVDDPQASPAKAGAAKPKAGPGRLARLFARDVEPGRERILTSPLVLGLAGSIVALALLGVALWGVIAKTAAQRLFSTAVDSYQDGDYRNAAKRFDAFLAANPKDPRAGKARVMSALAAVRQFASPAAPSWSNAVKAAGEMISAVGSLPEYRDFSTELAEVVLQAGEGLAGRAKASGDPAVLAEAEGAVRLHARASGAAAGPMLGKSRLPRLLAEARAAVEKARVRAAALAAMDAALKARSADNAYAARDALVKRYPDLAADRQVVKLLTGANEVIQAAAAFDASRRPAETTPNPDPLGPPTSLVLRSTAPGTPAPRPDPAGPMVYARVDGLAFGLDGATGAPTWQVPVGLSSPFTPRAIAGGGGVLVVDARTDELLRLDGRTGELAWRQALGEPVVDPPLILGDQAIQPTPGGDLIFVDLDSGEVRGTLRLGRPLSRTPVADEGGQFLYAMGEEAVAFVVRRDPVACVAVEYLGHARGSIPCPPARVGRFLIVPENHLIDSGRWRVFVLEQDGAKLRPAQELPVQGWTWATPASSGSVAWSIGDTGGATAYSLGLYSDKAPLKPIGRLGGDATPSGPAYATARSERGVWVASGRSTRLELDAERGRVTSSWTLGEAGPAAAPLQVAGNLAVLTQQAVDGAGVVLWGVAPESGTVRWRTALGPAWAVEPAASATGDGLAVLDHAGKPGSILAARLDAGGFVDQPLPRASGFRLPPGPIRRVDAGGVAVLVPHGEVDAVFVDDGPEPGTYRRLELPSPLSAPPLAWGPDLLIPGTDGRAYLIDPRTGASRAEPFLPPFEPGTLSRWLAPTAVDGGSVVLADASGLVRRLGRTAGDRPRLVATAEARLDRPILSDPAGTGEAVVLVTADGRCRSLAARDLSPIGAWPLDGAWSSGPVAAAGYAFVADAGGGVTAIGPDGRRAWTIPPGGPAIVGAPALAAGSAWFLTRDGVLRRHSLLDGASQSSLDLRITPVAGPVAVGDALAIPVGLGTFRMFREGKAP